jgi:hypothetical protein
MPPFTKRLDRRDASGYSRSGVLLIEDHLGADWAQEPVNVVPTEGVKAWIVSIVSKPDSVEVAPDSR